MSLSLIYIDDQEYNTKNWEFFAKLEGVQIKTYNSQEAFWNDKEQFEKSTPIYIDQDFGSSQITGIEFAKKLYDKGFKEIYIATGGIEDLGEVSWIKGIVGKLPPFM